VATPFVGREGELAALAADLAGALAGAGGVVLLAGEPGIGKTRLAEELAAQASARGALVPWGRRWEGGRAGVLALGPARLRLRPGRRPGDAAPRHGRRRRRRRPAGPRRG
jgi:hypothetical protein